MPGGNKKVTLTQTNLLLSAAGLFKHVWLFCYRQALKGKWPSPPRSDLTWFLRDPT